MTHDNSSKPTLHLPFRSSPVEISPPSAPRKRLTPSRGRYLAKRRERWVDIVCAMAVEQGVDAAFVEAHRDAVFAAFDGHLKKVKAVERLAILHSKPI